MNKVNVWQERVVIPTYETGAPDKNPMFLEKRVYQGSSGRIYPHTVIDKIMDNKVDKEYTAVFLENDYIKVMMLPELGGRIQRAYDKTNGYDFIYYNQVIKPALVGLAGPWISGGIEFNWPQHHRPSTFDAVEYSFAENEDGSATVWMGEIENMFRTEGVLGVTLYPDKAYIELSAKLYNRTNMPQTFLWWANPAVSVNDDTISVFPEDVNAVYDHGKRDVISFPYADGVYYKHHYDHVNIAQYKNIPVPTSYMAYRSDYNFIGEYDYGKRAGLLHVADHHIAPGKKQWTWGCGDFGKAWDRALTDEDGPYIELMTGCYTDNQPDFTWMLPKETKNFKQYFMPYKNIGYIKNATIDAAVNAVFDEKEKKLGIFVYATAICDNASVRVFKDGKCGKVLYEERMDISPVCTYEKHIKLEGYECEGDLEGIKVAVYSKENKELVAYVFSKKQETPIPEPAKAAPLPCDAKTTEDLFLYGMHIEQYRHATCRAEDYYLEGLRRDDTDIRLNNAYGRCLLGKCDFKGAEKHFRRAVEKAVRSNPNPYDLEPYYNLGLALKYQEETDKAYDAFYKSIWGGSYQASGFYELACIDVQRGDYLTALEHIDESLYRQYHSMKARALKENILRLLERDKEADALRKESIGIDHLYDRKPAKINHNTAIELIIDCYEAGLYRQGIDLASEWVECRNGEEIYPLIYYYMAYGYFKLAEKSNDMELRQQAEHYAYMGENANASGCFPHRLEDYVVLTTLTGKYELPMSHYYLGCLLYDKRVYDEAVRHYETAKISRPEFATVHRNLALAYYNVYKQPDRAYEELATAFKADETDSRVYMELDQLRRKMNFPIKERYEDMMKHKALVEDRDDMYLEYVTVLNTLGEYEEALRAIQSRNFHQWEGGEGKVAAQYTTALYMLARKAMASEEYEDARELLLQAVSDYPHNLGEGKLESAQENNLYYCLGRVYDRLKGCEAEAAECYNKASQGISEPAGMMYYNDQPPETIYYQGLSFRALGDEAQALERFNKLLDYGKMHIDDDVKTDYFAVSLPDLLIFDENLNDRNRRHCLFMMSLGYLGLGKPKEYEETKEKLLKLDNAHQGVMVHTMV